MRKILKVAVAAALVMSSLTWADTITHQLEFQGSTTGCFYTGVTACSTYSSPASLMEGSTTLMTFTGAAFDGTSNPSGALDLTLGTFNLFAVENNYNTETDQFVLDIAFLLPAWMDPAGELFTASITGNIVTDKLNGNVEVRFDNYTSALTARMFSNTTTQTVGSTQTTTTSSFSLYLDNLQGQTKLNIDNPRGSLTGHILNATETTTVTQLPDPRQVPEPASLGMVGAGMLGLAWVLRRRIAK